MPTLIRAALGGLGLVAGLLLGRSGPAPRVHEVRMGTNRFEPVETVARPGDTLRFLNGRGGLHNVRFFPDSMPEAARLLLERAMPGELIAPLSSPLLADPAEPYQFEIPALPPGRYPYVCMPHYAADMRGVLIVAP